MFSRNVSFLFSHSFIYFALKKASNSVRLCSKNKRETDYYGVFTETFFLNILHRFTPLFFYKKKKENWWHHSASLDNVNKQSMINALIFLCTVKTVIFARIFLVMRMLFLIKVKAMQEFSLIPMCIDPSFPLFCIEFSF